MKFGFKKNEESGGACSEFEHSPPPTLPPTAAAKSKSGFFSKSKTSEEVIECKKSKKQVKAWKNDALHRGGVAGVIDINSVAPVTSTKVSTDMLAHKSRGDSLVQKAEATEGKSSWFSFESNESTQKKDGNAAKLLKKAANAYTLAGCDDEAGKAYQRAAEIYKNKLKDKVEASRCLTDAGEVLKKSYPTESNQCYQSAVSLLIEAGKLNDVVSMGLSQGDSNGAKTKMAPVKMNSKKSAAPTKIDVKDSKVKNMANAKARVCKPRKVVDEKQKTAAIFGSFSKQMLL